MPLNLAKIDVTYIVQKLCGKETERHHLSTLGFTPGCEIRVLSKLSGYYVVLLKGSKIGLEQRLAQKIIITEAAI